MKQFMFVVVILVAAPFCTCSAQIPSSNREGQLRQKGIAVLMREESRKKAGFCASADITVAMNECFSKELKVTNQNYTDYVESLAQLVRLNPGWRLTGTSHGFREFKLAEAAWKTYREKSCEAIENRDDGGSGAPTDFLTCELSLTGNHMQELDNTYSNVWR